MNKKSIFKDRLNKNLIHSKTQDGITLIALVVTIVVLIILATISISIVFSENGIVRRAQNSSSTYKQSQEDESDKLDLYANHIDNNTNPKDNKTEVPEKKAPKDTVIKVLNKDGNGGDGTYSGQTKTFENVEINTTENNANYSGFTGMKGTFKNCTINGKLVLYQDCTFIDCEFNITGDDYNIWTWGAENIKFVNCNFFSDGKALLVYGSPIQDITIENCVFVDNGGLEDLKAAIEIGNDYNTSYNLNIKNTTVFGYEINNKGINTGTTLWANKNSMGQDKLNVVVDGVDVY